MKNDALKVSQQSGVLCKKKLLKCKVGIVDSLKKLFSKFYGKVSVISCPLCHFIAKNYILYINCRFLLVSLMKNHHKSNFIC